jgi:glyoxylase-like metal-dependent hydrolase (beta-lactamase superfamily II)
VERARQEDAHHWAPHQRPISAETLRRGGVRRGGLGLVGRQGHARRANCRAYSTVDRIGRPAHRGVNARHAPGHTPGSFILVVTSGEDSAYLLGDVVHSPLQLTNSGIAFATDADVALATRTRSALLREMEQATAIGMNHISGFHRITRSWLPAR